MITKDNIQLLKKFLEGNANSEEEKVVYELFYSHANDLEFKQIVENQFNATVWNRGIKVTIIDQLIF